MSQCRAPRAAMFSTPVLSEILWNARYTVQMRSCGQPVVIQVQLLWILCSHILNRHSCKSRLFLSATIKVCWNFVLQLVGNHGAHVIWKTLVRGSLARLGDIVSQITEMRNDRDSGQTSFDCRYWDLHILIFTWDFTWEDKNREEVALCSLKDSKKRMVATGKVETVFFSPKCLGLRDSADLPPVPGCGARPTLGLWRWPTVAWRGDCETPVSTAFNSIQQLTWRIWSQNLQIVFVSTCRMRMGRIRLVNTPWWAWMPAGRSKVPRGLVGR